MMKKQLVSFLSLSLILVSCASPTPTTTPPTPTASPLPSAIPTPPTDILQTPWEDRSLFKDGLVESQRSILNGLVGASVYHLEFNIAEDIYHISGYEEVQYTNTEDVALNEVQFRLFPNILGGKMDVSNVHVDDESISPKLELQDSLMIVPLKEVLQPGQSTVIGMDFEVTAPREVELNYGVFAYYDDVLALAHSYPVICVYDDEGWNAELPPQDGDVTYADAAFYLVKVTAPAELTLVSSGREIRHDEEGQTQASYIANGPARDFYLVASPGYEEISQTFGEVTIHSYAMDGSEDGAALALDVASKAMGVFDKRYMLYPYTEFDIVSTPNLALGIEYPGMIAITSRIYDVGTSPSDVYMESTVAHEVGHQWFYSFVGNDQLDDPWLDESLTQFATLQYYEDLYGAPGAAGFQESLKGRWASMENADIPIGLPVSDYEGRQYGAIVYGRGPLFFVALRDQMGREAFDAFLKEYAESLAWGIATPEYLQALAEKHCACELDTLFDEWVNP